MHYSVLLKRVYNLVHHNFSDTKRETVKHVWTLLGNNTFSGKLFGTFWDMFGNVWDLLGELTIFYTCWAFLYSFKGKHMFC